MQLIGLFYSGVGNLGNSGDIRYRLGALSPKLKLRLRSVVPKELCSFHPKSLLEVGEHVFQISNPSEPMGTPRATKSWRGGVGSNRKGLFYDRSCASQQNPRV